MKKSLVFFAISLCGLLLGFFVGKRLYFWEKIPSAPDDTKFYDSVNFARIAFYAHYPLEKGDTIIAGNSIAESFPVSEAFPGRHIRNRGIGGNDTRRLLVRIGDIARSQPSMIILEIGIDDIRGHIPEDTILFNLGRICDTIRANSRAKIVLQEIMPVGRNHAALNPIIVSVNARIDALASRRDLLVLRLHDAFLKGALMDSSYTVDGIHLSGDGYMIWKQKLDSVFRRAPQQPTPPPSSGIGEPAGRRSDHGAIPGQRPPGR